MLHISQPTLTRTMQHVEEDFGAILFKRGKNRIELTNTGQLAQHSEVTFEQLNGFNCLLRDQIGFWTQLCKQHMPASRFLIQTDEFEFNELIRTSTLFHFITDYTSIQNELDKSRVKIPIVSPEANVTFHLIYKKAKANLL